MYEVLNYDLPGFNGTAWLISHGFGYYVVSRAFTFDRGDETMIFASSPDGGIHSWHDLYAGYSEDHATAIRNWIDQK